MARHEKGALAYANSKDSTGFVPHSTPGVPGQPRTADAIAKAEAQIRLMRRGQGPARGPVLTTAQLAGLPRDTLSAAHNQAIETLQTEAGTDAALPRSAHYNTLSSAGGATSMHMNPIFL